MSHICGLMLNNYIICVTQIVFLGFSMKDPNLRRLLELANKEGSKKNIAYFYRKVSMGLQMEK